MEMIRAALYIRVSTEEQAREGYSVAAQKSNLTEYAKKHGYSIVGIYSDEGISARKKYKKRKELMRLLDDVESDKIDIILFIKLDRWFRNVADFYKIQEILDRNKVNWATTLENYDTSTASGRLYVNIRLAIAQDECDRTSERIKFVFDKKVKDGEIISGSVHFGYSIDENKKIIKDPNEEDFVNLIFSEYLKIQTVNGVAIKLNNLRDKPLSYQVYRRVLKENLAAYTGLYKDNENYFPKYLTLEEFKEIQAINERNITIRNTLNQHNYIFLGLLRCNECGRRIAGGGYITKYNKRYYNYRCIGRNANLCPAGGNRISEIKLEKQMLDKITAEIEKYKVNYLLEIKSTKKASISSEMVKRKIDRLRKLYLNELIDYSDYEKEFTILNQSLKDALKIENEVDKKTKDFSTLDQFLKNDFKEIYFNLDELERRALWSSVISNVNYDLKNKKIVDIEFK